MPRRGRQQQNTGEPVEDFRHEEARRRNNPPAGIAPTYEVRQQETRTYVYDPHLDPQLVWAGKAEHTSFEVDVVSLHIHERISTRAILDAVRRPQPPQLSLFGETPLPADQQIEFYKHEVGWANRLILGDSLLVMNSLLVKEGMAGKVQMVYIDPPYGIKYSSNFQPRIDRRDVKDKDEDLTHEPEQIKAYRDTWKLGIHSYLTYLRDRLLLARELLTESGSVFVQINDENLHLVRCLLDEVFGRENFVAVIAFRKKQMPLGAEYLDSICDYLLWYAKDRTQMKYNQIFSEKLAQGDPAWAWVRCPDHSFRRMTTGEVEDHSLLPTHSKVFQSKSLKPAGFNPSCVYSVWFQGHEFRPVGSWVTNDVGMRRLIEADRVLASAGSLRYVLYFDDYQVTKLSNVWVDTGGAADKVYAVQTTDKVVERCILMTTDPGDLVFDPTCVRKGTGVLVANPTPAVLDGLAPTPSLPAGGEGEIPPPSTGEARRGVSSRRLTGEARRGVDLRGDVTPTPALPAGGEGEVPPPSTGEARRGVSSRWLTGEAKREIEPTYLPIESVQPGQFVIGHDGHPHRVRRVIRKQYRGAMVGLRHALTEQTLWLTADHLVLAKLRPRSLGGNRDWSASPPDHLHKRRQLRREMTATERILWSRLRNAQVGYKFRRQHPVGPYIVDFYCREAHLVVEVDGDTHFTPDAQLYDLERDRYMHAMGLDVLRFTTDEVRHNLEGVLMAIHNRCRIRRESVKHAQWVPAGELVPGDIVFFGTEQVAVPITHVEWQFSDEEVYDLEVEGAHSFITEVCVVHNCGSGTTAYCAEKWGRRWITCDTSRVALAIARQRLMTARFDYYELLDPERGPAGGFVYETVPHITLESIAKNTEIDTIAEKYQPQIDAALAELNRALGTTWREWEVPREVPHPVWSQEAHDAYWNLYRTKGRALPADNQQVEDWLQAIYRLTGHVWKSLDDVPEPIPAPDWSEEAKDALRRFWEAKRAKRKEIDESIQRNAPQEVLYDRPKTVRGVVRVSGPFTVEAIPVPAVEDPSQSPIPQFEEGMETERVSDRAGDYLTTMLNLLKGQGGVLFPGGKRLELTNLRPLHLGYLHAEGETTQDGNTLRVAISFGPQHGPVTALQVQEATPIARLNGYQILIFAGFSFDPEAQALIQRVPVPGLQVHFANIAPDVLVGDLLKTTRASQIFTVFGQPDVRVVKVSPTPSLPAGGEGEIPPPSTGEARRGVLSSPSTGEVMRGVSSPPSTGEVRRGATPTYIVELRGVDIYDPLTGEVHSTRGEDVAAWFLDTDYDGMTFHICQAFFPGDPDAWDKLQRALKAQIDPEVFEQMRGTVSFPFQPGKHQRIAVKVIDFRGNEVVRVMKLEEA